MTYAEQLKDVRWQQKKSAILTRDNFLCQYCKEPNKTVHVHHVDYISGTMAWEYPNDMLVTLCEDCHTAESARPKCEKYLCNTLRMKGFFISDLFALSSKIDTDDHFTKQLIKVLREFQHG